MDHLWDLESDFSAVHRVGNMYSLPCPKFFAFAYRIASYKGVMRLLIEAENEGNSAQQRKGAPVSGSTEYREIPDDAVTFDPELSDLIEVAEG